MKPAPVFAKIRSQRSFETVVQQVRSLIDDGALRLGDRLPAERELALQLGVSRNTVREALRSLENAGLVTLRKGVTGGAFVSNHSDTVVLSALGDLYRIGAINTADLTEARLLLGREVARLACMRWTDADLTALEENVKRTKELAALGDLNARVDNNLEFHKLLALATRNPVLVLLTRALVDVTRHLVHAMGPMPNTFVLASRDRMLRHLRARNAEAASDEMALYLQRVQRRYFEKIATPVVKAKRAVRVAG